MRIDVRVIYPMSAICGVKCLSGLVMSRETRDLRLHPVLG